MSFQRLFRSIPYIVVVLLSAGPIVSGCSRGPSGDDGRSYTTDPLAHERLMASYRAFEGANLADALREVEEAGRIDPDSPQIMALHGEILTELGRIDEARYVLEKLVERYPRYEQAWFKLGNVALNQERFEEATTFFRNEIELKPTSSAWHNLGLAYIQLDQLGDARSAFNSAQKLDPTYVHAYAALADLSEREGDFESALEYARQASERLPENNRLQEKYGFMLLRAGRAEEALPVLRTVVEREPWDYQARYNYGQALQRLGETAEAEVQLQRAESDREGQGDLRKLERAVRQDPSNGRLFFALGIEYQKWRRVDDAFRSYQVAHQLLPDNPLVALNMATLYIHRGDFDEASRRLTELVQQDSAFASAWLNLGFAEARRGNLERAEAAWGRAVRYQPEYSAAVAKFRERQQVDSQ